MLMAFLRGMGEEDFYQWNNLCLKKLGLPAKKNSIGVSPVFRCVGWFWRVNGHLSGHPKVDLLSAKFRWIFW